MRKIKSRLFVWCGGSEDMNKKVALLLGEEVAGYGNFEHRFPWGVAHLWDIPDDLQAEAFAAFRREPILFFYLRRDGVMVRFDPYKKGDYGIMAQRYAESLDPEQMIA